MQNDKERHPKIFVMLDLKSSLILFLCFNLIIAVSFNVINIPII